MADLSHGGLKLEGAKQLRAGDVIEVTTGPLCHPHFHRDGLAHVPGRYGLSKCEPGRARPDGRPHLLPRGPQEAIEAVDHFVAQQLKCRAAKNALEPPGFDRVPRGPPTFYHQP